MTSYQDRGVGRQGPEDTLCCSNLHSILKALGSHRRTLKTWFSERSLQVAVMNDAIFCRIPSSLMSEAKEWTWVSAYP